MGFWGRARPCAWVLDWALGPEMTLRHTPEAGLRRLQLCTVVFHLPTLQLPRITLPLLHALAACTIMSRYLQYLQRQCPKTGNPRLALEFACPLFQASRKCFLCLDSSTPRPTTQFALCCTNPINKQTWLLPPFRKSVAPDCPTSVNRIQMVSGSSLSAGPLFNRQAGVHNDLAHRSHPRRFGHISHHPPLIFDFRDTSVF